MQKRFRKVITSLVISAPFYGLFSRHFYIIRDDRIPTCGVRYKSKKLELLYNHEWVEKLTEEELTEVIKHECLHASLGHLNIGRMDKVWNIAFDCALNAFLNTEIVVRLNGCVAGAEYPVKTPFTELLSSLPPNKSGEFYEAKLREEEEKVPGEPTFDAHLMGDEDEDGEEHLKKIAGNVISQLENDGTWGSMPEELRKRVEAFVYGTYDWSQHVKNIVRRTRSTTILSSRKRVNKRFPHMFPGVMREYRPKICVAVDESGSVDDQMWLTFAEKLSSLSKYASFTYVPFDSEVHSDQMKEFKFGDKFRIERRRCGGTDFNAVTTWFNDNCKDFDALFIVTDGECSEPSRAKKKRSWVLPEGKDLMFGTNENVIKVAPKE